MRISDWSSDVCSSDLLRPEVIDLNQRVRAMLTMLETTLSPNISLNADLDENLSPVEVDPGQLEVALLNIIVNARDAMPEGGAITIRTRNVTGEESGDQIGRANV